MKADPIRLFDANCHPTVAGGWPSKNLDSRLKTLSSELTKNHYRGACAVGVWGLERYAHRAFLDLCEKNANLVPIAGYFPQSASTVGGELKAILEMGYRGIKIHPRDPPIDLNDPRLVKAFQAAARLQLPIFLCTYFHSTAESYPVHDPLYDIVALLQKAPKARVLLVHGGDVNLLRYAELVRFNPNLLLDLSMTFMKYQGSSLDLDIRFLFERFDRRICIGTDFPEYTHREVRKRFAEMSRGLGREKAENIAYRNIENFLKP
jgi:predicted TIM-barrel fold metal-dependent hydrolase